MNAGRTKRAPALYSISNAGEFSLKTAGAEFLGRRAEVYFSPAICLESELFEFPRTEWTKSLLLSLFAKVAGWFVHYAASDVSAGSGIKFGGGGGGGELGNFSWVFFY